MKSWLASHIVNNNEWIPRTEKLNLVNRSITTLRSTYTNIVWSSKNKNQVLMFERISMEFGTPQNSQKGRLKCPYKYLHSPQMWNSNLFSVDSRCCRRRRGTTKQQYNIYLVYTQIFHFWSEIYLGLKNETPRFHFGNLLCSARSTTR